MTNRECQHFEDTDCNDFLNCCDCGYRDYPSQCCPYCWSCNACDNCYAERQEQF